jgi:hypothetical protein
MTSAQRVGAAQGIQNGQNLDVVVRRAFNMTPVRKKLALSTISDFLH